MQQTDGRQQHLSTAPTLSPRRPPLSLPPGPPSNYSTECLHHNDKHNVNNTKFNTINHYHHRSDHSTDTLDSDGTKKYYKLLSAINNKSNTKSAKNHQLFNVDVYNGGEMPIVRMVPKSSSKGDKSSKTPDNDDADTSSTFSTEYLQDVKHPKKNVSKHNTFNHYDVQKNSSAEILDADVCNKYSELFIALKSSHENKKINTAKSSKSFDATDEKQRNQYLCDINLDKDEKSVARVVQKSSSKNEKHNKSGKTINFQDCNDEEAELCAKFSMEYFQDNIVKNPKKTTSKFNTFNHYELQKNHSKEMLDTEVFNKYSKLFSAIKALNESKIVNSETKPSTQHSKSFDLTEDKRKNYYCDIDVGKDEPTRSTSNKVSVKNDKYDKVSRTSDSQYTSNDADSVQSFELDSIPVYNLKTVRGPQYVDMDKVHKDKKLHSNNALKEKGTSRNMNSKQIVQIQQNDTVSEKQIKKNTRKGSYDLKVMPSFKAANENYEYQQNKVHGYPHKPHKKRTSITSSTSEENEESQSVATRSMHEDRHKSDRRKNKFESATVDRKLSKKRSANNASKMKRRGSCNFDSSDDFHLPQDMSKMRGVSHSVKNCASGKMQFGDKTPLEISTEDMVQIANCGARNKNGSLCHFISTNNDNYLSISQALLNNTVSNNNTLTRKKKQNKKRSMTSLPFDSSDEETISVDNVIDFRQKSNEYLESEVKSYRSQKSYDESKVKSSKSKPASKINDLGIAKTLNGYFVLKDEPLKLKREPSNEQSALGRKSTRDSNHLTHNNHSVLQSDCLCRDGGEVTPGNSQSYKVGVSGKEELRPLGDVEESFDF